MLGPVALAALFAVVRLGLETADVPADDAYPALYAALAADGFDAGQDAIAVFPAWSLRAWVDAPVRPISSDVLSEDDLLRYRRVYLVVEPDPSDEHERFVAQRGPGELVHEGGRLRLVRYALSGPRVVYDFREHLQDAVIEIQDRSGETQVVCTDVIALGVHCDGRKEWQRLTREWRLVTENGREVMWAHPPKKPERLVVKYPGAGAQTLSVGWGFTRTGSEKKDAPVHFTVRVGDEVVLDESVPRAFRFRQKTVRAAQPGPVTFEIWAEQSNARAHFTFDAYALGDEDRP